MVSINRQTDSNLSSLWGLNPSKVPGYLESSACKYCSPDIHWIVRRQMCEAVAIVVPFLCSVSEGISCFFVVVGFFGGVAVASISFCVQF